MARAHDGSLVAHYDYALPEALVAQYPADRRDESRLLTLPPSGPIRHGRFPDFVDLLEAGDALVVNDSRVFPARLLGRKPTGSPAEVLLVRPAGLEGEHVWQALVRPGGKLKPGRRVVVGDDLEVEILEALPSGVRIVRLLADDPEAALERHGRIPLPPYIHRADELLDRERYQTVYARSRGSVAAPTAGLHFTEPLLDRIERKGVALGAVTLHVGVGTFRPVEGDDPADHEMHAERYFVSTDVADMVNRARNAGGRVWAVGTTAVRTLETATDPGGRVRAGEGETRLFIRPPYTFRVVDGLLTNFHLPRSTLLMLVAALAGYDRTMGAYAEAVRERYRFYSYGDAMAVLPALTGR